MLRERETSGIDTNKRGDESPLFVYIDRADVRTAGHWLDKDK